MMNQPDKNTPKGMTTLYDSDAFIVMHLHTPDLGSSLENANHSKASSGNTLEKNAEGSEQQAGAQLMRDGFEIVDKRASRYVYLDGSWAEHFHKQIMQWRATTPTQEEVEDALERYSGVVGQNLSKH